MRKKETILNAIETIKNNNELTYSYKEDCINILKWVIEEIDSFDGL